MTSLRRRRRQKAAPLTEILIAAAGLAAAAVSGVIAYRMAGPYADGPLNVGIHRTTDPESGRPQIYRETRTADGATVRYVFDDQTRALREVRRTVSAGGTPEEQRFPIADAGPRAAQPDKVGFSLRRDGVIDAWEFRDANGQLQKIEVARQRGGRVDRWEYYQNGQLARVEEDEDRDGRVDRWLTYEAGILIREARDRNGDGRPDPPQ